MSTGTPPPYGPHLNHSGSPLCLDSNTYVQSYFVDQLKYNTSLRELLTAKILEVVNPASINAMMSLLTDRVAQLETENTRLKSMVNISDCNLDVKVDASNGNIDVRVQILKDSLETGAPPEIILEGSDFHNIQFPHEYS